MNSREFVGRAVACAAAMRTDGDASVEALVSAGKRLGFGTYVIVDEYDNFTNDIVSTPGLFRDPRTATPFCRNSRARSSGPRCRADAFEFS